MKTKLFTLFVLLLSMPSAFGLSHGVSYDLNNGIGYTAMGEKLWGGISVSTATRRFDDNQMVLNTRFYGNYKVCEQGKVASFLGGSYTDRFGLKNDSMVDKHRVLALTMGISAKVLENLQLATWVNVWAAHENLPYNSTTQRREFTDTNSDQNRQTLFDFGGLMATYIF